MDREVIQDMKDTLRANSHKCVGMAANMIGVHKNIIIIHTETGEGCLSLPGVRKTTRYRVVTVRYEDESFKKHVETFAGFTAEIVQHEMDHLQGILI